jgi:hypothetical protein
MTHRLPELEWRAAELLRQHPVIHLRHLKVVETESELVISGTVSSYSLKQMAQEAVRSAANGCRLRNQVNVVRPSGG